MRENPPFKINFVFYNFKYIDFHKFNMVYKLLLM